MDRLPTESGISTDRPKTNLWTRMKRRNASSPSLHTLGNKNWSSRSLPRFGAFGSSSTVHTLTSPSHKSSLSCTPVEEISPAPFRDTSPRKLRYAKDYFSILPNEVKLQIFSYLSVKTIAQISSVSPISLHSDCRSANYGVRCAMTVLCTEQLILGHFTEISRPRYYSPCWYLPAPSFDISIFEDVPNSVPTIYSASLHGLQISSRFPWKVVPS